MAWSSKNSLLSSASVTTGSRSSKVTTNPKATHHIEIEADFPATPTDDLVWELHGTLDASSENWDDTPIMAGVIPNTIDPNKISFSVSGLYAYSLYVYRDGSTDTITVNADYREDGVSA